MSMSALIRIDISQQVFLVRDRLVHAMALYRNRGMCLMIFVYLKLMPKNAGRWAMTIRSKNHAIFVVITTLGKELKARIQL